MGLLMSLLSAGALLGLMCAIALLSNRLVYSGSREFQILTKHLRRRVRRVVFAVVICWGFASTVALAFGAPWLVVPLTLVMLAILAGCAWEFGRGLL
jgi:hypothetical protein